jgi:hypothetical protein
MVCLSHSQQLFGNVKEQLDGIRRQFDGDIKVQTNGTQTVGGLDNLTNYAPLTELCCALIPKAKRMRTIRRGSKINFLGPLSSAMSNAMLISCVKGVLH